MKAIETDEVLMIDRSMVLEEETTANEGNKSDQERIDHAAMQSAKRAQNRILSNEETTPGNSVFSK